MLASSTNVVTLKTQATRQAKQLLGAKIACFKYSCQNCESFTPRSQETRVYLGVRT